MRWTIDLAVVGGKNKETPYAAIFCIDMDASGDVENALNRAAAAFQDMYLADGMMVLAVRKNREKQILPRGYDQLFASMHVDVLEWNPKHAFELVVELLHCLRRQHDGKRMQGVKSVRDTAKDLTDKYPDLFTDHRQVPKKTNCLELLHQIKQSDQHANFGEIIKNALSQEGICQSLVGSRLSSISDVKLEKLLKEYLEQQK